jgi:hypothetical protein
MVSKKGESQAPEVVQTSTRILEDTAKTDASADTKAADTKTDDTKAADTKAADTKATDAKTETKAEPYLTMLTQKETHTADFSYQKTETKNLFDFSMKFSADQNSKYGWGCQATSLNPNADNAAFKSKALGGYTTTAKVAVVATTGDSVLWSSFFAMIIMVVGVFFY